MRQKILLSVTPDSRLSPVADTEIEAMTCLLICQMKKRNNVVDRKSLRRKPTVKDWTIAMHSRRTCEERPLMAVTAAVAAATASLMTSTTPIARYTRALAQSNHRDKTALAALLTG